MSKREIVLVVLYSLAIAACFAWNVAVDLGL